MRRTCTQASERDLIRAVACASERDVLCELMCDSLCDQARTVSREARSVSSREHKRVAKEDDVSESLQVSSTVSSRGLTREVSCESETERGPGLACVVSRKIPRESMRVHERINVGRGVRGLKRRPTRGCSSVSSKPQVEGIVGRPVSVALYSFDVGGGGDPRALHGSSVDRISDVSSRSLTPFAWPTTAWHQEPIP